MKEVMEFGKYKAEIYAKDIYDYMNVNDYFKSNSSIIYVNSIEPIAEEIFCNMKVNNVILVEITGIDWNSEMSPWPADRVFKGGEDFQGKSSQYLEVLTEKIIPEIEKGIIERVSSKFSDENKIINYPFKRGIAGYSLAGLFAVWAVCNSDKFVRVASVSGSMWYDGFYEYIKTYFYNMKKNVNGMTILTECAYFSVGDHEKNTKNKRMAVVEDCTEAIVEKFEECGIKVIYELNSGGHFDDVGFRMKRAIEFLSMDKYS